MSAAWVKKKKNMNWHFLSPCLWAFSQTVECIGLFNVLDRVYSIPVRGVWRSKFSKDLSMHCIPPGGVSEFLYSALYCMQYGVSSPVTMWKCFEAVCFVCKLEIVYWSLQLKLLTISLSRLDMCIYWDLPAGLLVQQSTHRCLQLWWRHLGHVLHTKYSSIHTMTLYAQGLI